jgi:hypothetical protein
MMTETTTDSSAPLMMAVIWPVTTISLIVLVLRCYSKLRSQGRLWWDDWLMIVAWIALLSQAIITQVAIHAGFGRHLVDVLLGGESLEQLALWSEVSFTMAVPSIIFSKLSFALTLTRLTRSYWRAFVIFCMVTLVLVMVPSIVTPWVACIPFEKLFNPSVPGQCMDKSIPVNFGIFDSAYSATMDFALAMLPWKIVWNLQMDRAEKIGIGVAMSLGVFSGIAAIIKSVALAYLGTSTDPTCKYAPTSAVEAGSCILFTDAMLHHRRRPLDCHMDHNRIRHGHRSRLDPRAASASQARRHLEQQ